MVQCQDFQTFILLSASIQYIKSLDNTWYLNGQLYNIHINFQENYVLNNLF